MASDTKNNAKQHIDTTIKTIFHDPRDFLLEEEPIQNIKENSNYNKCPEIHIMIDNLETVALLDTGSKLSAISQEF